MKFSDLQNYIFCYSENSSLFYPRSQFTINLFSKGTIQFIEYKSADKIIAHYHDWEGYECEYIFDILENICVEIIETKIVHQYDQN